jgi:hypothetical protein
MIPLVLPAKAGGSDRFITRLCANRREDHSAQDSIYLESAGQVSLFSGERGLLQIEGCPSSELFGDIVVVDPQKKIVERLIRAQSLHNTFLITERCDQLCVMCSQPPKKFHIDRFGTRRDDYWTFWRRADSFYESAFMDARNSYKTAA